MKPVIFSILLIFSALLFSSGVSVQSASAQVKTSEQLAAENLEKFQEWRKTIPDYEKRLYDRVRSVNKRTVRIQGSLIIGLVVLFLLNGAALFFLFVRFNSTRSRSGGRRQALGGDPGGGYDTSGLDQEISLLHGKTNKIPIILAQISRDIEKLQETSLLLEEKLSGQGPALPMFVNLIRKLAIGRIVEAADRRKIKQLLRRQVVLLNAIADLHQSVQTTAGDSKAVGRLVDKIEQELEQDQKELS